MPQEEKIKWYYRPIPVLVLLFVVIGPLALPLLYKSPHFSKFWKVLLTIGVVIFTLYLVWAFIKMWKLTSDLLKEVNRGY
jgi:uncharacterized membrane protein